MNLRIGERITKTLATIIICPFLMLIMVLLALLMLALPIIVFIRPEVFQNGINIKNEAEK